jgi:hypothetical protein
MMLFLIADIMINMINRGMRNTKHTKTALPNKFFKNEIIAMDKIGATSLDLFDDISD